MTTHVLMVTDMSGSMSGLAGDVRGGFNAYLDGLAADTEGSYQITASLFDHEYMPLCTGAALADVPRLSVENYKPRGTTALLDAVGRTVADFELRVSSLGDDDKVILVVQTDGFENASKEFTSSAVRKLLADRTADGGKWAVLYIGAGVDSWSQAEAMGVKLDSYVHTSGSAAATGATYRSMTAATVAYAGGAGAGDAGEIVRKATRGL